MHYDAAQWQNSKMCLKFNEQITPLCLKTELRRYLHGNQALKLERSSWSVLKNIWKELMGLHIISKRDICQMAILINYFYLFRMCMCGFSAIWRQHCSF